MIAVNEYFNGNVKSLALASDGGKATLGVIAAGEYEFGTATVEIMTVVSGSLEALLPGKKNWKTYKAGKAFTVAKGEKFKVRAAADVGYLCLYK